MLIRSTETKDADPGQAAPEGAGSEEPVASPGSSSALPTMKPEDVAAPPPEPTKSKKDFFLCIGVLLLFGILCFGGIVVLRYFVFENAKIELLDGTRKANITNYSANGGVANKNGTAS